MTQIPVNMRGGQIGLQDFSFDSFVVGFNDILQQLEQLRLIHARVVNYIPSQYHRRK